MQESTQKEKVNVFRFIYGYTRGYRVMFLCALATTLSATFFSFMTPQIIRLTIDSIIGDKQVDLPFGLTPWFADFVPREMLRSNLMIPAAAVAALAAGTLISNFLRRYFVQVFAEGSVKRLREQLFEQTQLLPYEWHIRIQTGDVIQRCISDVETIREFLSNQLIELFRVSVMIVMAIIMMLSIHVKLATICLAFIPVIFLYSNFFYSRVSKRFRKADEAEGQVMTVVQENLTGVRVVRAFGREAYEMDKFNKSTDHYTTMWVSLGMLMGAYWGTGEFVTGIQKVIVLSLGVAEVVNETGLYLGGLVALMTYNTYLIWPIRGLGRILSDLSRTAVAIDRVNEVLREEREESAGGIEDFEFTGEISFKNVSFGYGEHDVLRNLSFTIPAGTSLAVLGGTGSGKSTIANLIPRLYELEDGQGSITMDGVDIRSIALNTLRKQVGLVLQEPFLFSRSIRDNIKAANSELSDEQVRYAAEVARVDHSICAFEQGYDTIVGERGVTLSGGQQQRVSIARMIAQQPKIMIFDDSLSAVDTKTDAEIRAALRQTVGDATTITISHRITTLMMADKILLLERGEIVDEGTHDELIAKGGTYKRIYDLQMGIDPLLLQGVDA